MTTPPKKRRGPVMAPPGRLNPKPQPKAPPKPPPRKIGTQPIGKPVPTAYPGRQPVDKATVAAAAKAARAAAAKSKTTPGGSGDPNSYGGLTGDKRDAAVALTSLFKSYGLETLAPQIIKMIQNGFSSDTIAIELQNTKEYQQRFAANATRLKNGLPVLSPAEYISTERSYRQVMSAAGLPIGFYDSTHDFQKFLEGDVSPTEVQSRVNTAAEAIQKAPAGTVDYFKKWYNTGDLIAYALDPTVAAPLVEQRIKAAESGAIAAGNGLALSKGSAELIGRTGASYGDIQSGVNFVSQESKTTDKLSQLYGGGVTSDDIVSEVFDNNAVAAEKRKALASRERASFTGTSAQGKTSLSKDSGGF